MSTKIWFGFGGDVVLEERIFFLFSLFILFSSVAHVLVILGTFIKGMIGKLRKVNSWLELRVWEIFESSILGKCKRLLVLTVVYEDQG